MKITPQELISINKWDEYCENHNISVYSIHSSYSQKQEIGLGDLLEISLSELKEGAYPLISCKGTKQYLTNLYLKNYLDARIFNDKINTCKIIDIGGKPKKLSLWGYLLGLE